jgi:endonuclease VIII
MPEGDTIFRTAAVLRQWLEGREVTAARAVTFPGALLVGDRVESVEARAKHLLIRFASGKVLHTHMRMTGAWHVYPTGERWRRPGWQARVVLETGDHTAVCYNAPVVELLAPGGEEAHPALAGLGPDILVPPVDLVEVRRRAGLLHPDTEIGDLLLDQQVVSGIGNIWRCETLFVARVHPRQPSRSLPDGALESMVETAATLMAASAAPPAPGDSAARIPGRVPGPPGGARWVYGRTRRPCRRCRTPIAAARVGVQARTAYWCPRCQPPP